MCLVIWWLNGFKASMVIGKADRPLFNGLSAPSNFCDVYATRWRQAPCRIFPALQELPTDTTEVT